MVSYKACFYISIEEGGDKLIKVYIKNPIVNGDTVSFAWHSDKHIHLLKAEKYYVKYEGMNIQGLNKEVLWHVFLSTMLPVFNLSKEKVELIFPVHLPAYLAETWINYHAAANVAITPLSNMIPIKPAIRKNKQSNTKVGLLFGGGKDSTCAFSMLSEIYGMDNMVLISYVAPMTRRPIADICQRRERLLLGPLRRDLNVKIQKVITDVRTIIIDKDTTDQIHIALFVGPALPIILHYNLNILTFSYEFNCYYTNYHDSQEEMFHFMRSRPEYCSYIAERTNKLFGTDHIIIDPNFSFSILVAFKILKERYPHMLKYLFMCETIADPNKKWCYGCKKCATMALFCLRYLKGEGLIDINRALAENQFIKNVLDDNKLLPSAQSNIVMGIDLQLAREKLTEEAYKNLMALRDKFGHLENECFESFILPAFEKQNLPEPLAARLKSIITQHCPTVNEVKTFLYGGKKVDIDFSLISEVPDVFKHN